MIPAALVPPHAAPAVRWQQLWREAVRDPRELLAMLGLDPIATGMSDEACAQFARVADGLAPQLPPVGGDGGRAGGGGLGGGGLCRYHCGLDRAWPVSVPL